MGGSESSDYNRYGYDDGVLENIDYTGNIVYIRNHRYVYEKKLGAGGFGSVYKARNSRGKPVAIKITSFNDASPGHTPFNLQTYLGEVKLLRLLRRETRHVVQIYDFDINKTVGEGYIVMELGNENLLTLVERLRALSGGRTTSVDEEMMRAFWKQIVSILLTLSRHGVVHMDLKPDNLILFGITLKIADLGISKKIGKAGVGGMGTIGYSAPEIMLDKPGIQRDYGPKADIWSLGAILYFMVYGQPPPYFPGRAHPPPGRHAHPDPELNDALRHTLVSNPNARFDLNQVMKLPFTSH